MISPLCGVSNFYEMTDLTPEVDLLTVRDEIDYRSLTVQRIILNRKICN